MEDGHVLGSLYPHGKPRKGSWFLASGSGLAQPFLSLILHFCLVVVSAWWNPGCHFGSVPVSLVSDLGFAQNTSSFSVFLIDFWSPKWLLWTIIVQQLPFKNSCLLSSIYSKRSHQLLFNWGLYTATPSFVNRLLNWPALFRLDDGIRSPFLALLVIYGSLKQKQIYLYLSCLYKKFCLKK